MKILRIEVFIFLALVVATMAFRMYHSDKHAHTNGEVESPHLVILGIAQDAGYPQINCKKTCCEKLWGNPEMKKSVSCIGIKDPKTKKAWLIDATPDIKDQLHQLLSDEYTLEGIFLTHAHIGHYTGLMELGREAMGADAVPVYVMPKMKTFIETNGPWDQLVKLNNIKLIPLENNKPTILTESISIVPMQVPHRDEYSETVGYTINSTDKSALFIPDIDKWDKWDRDINEEIAKVDYAFLDGTFYRNGEIWGRDMSDIPHPFIQESMSYFNKLSASEKNKIYFIHLNHTNPLLDKSSEERQSFDKKRYHVAREGQIVDL